MIPKNNNFKCWGGDWKALLYRKIIINVEEIIKLENCHFADTTVMTHSSNMHVLMDSKTIRGEITGEQDISIVSKYHLTEYLLVNKEKSTWKWKIPQITP